MQHAPHDLWVFGYGSLMWNPGFAFAEAERARLVGYRRAMCIYSVHYRGSVKRPGLVLGLDRGGVCEGVAFRVEANQVRDVRRYLSERELIYGVYREMFLPVTLVRPGLPQVRALAYVAESRHPSYAGHLPPRLKAQVVRGARGKAGTNIDYLANTLGHLAAMGIRDFRLQRVAAFVGAFATGGAVVAGRRARALAMARSWGRAGAPKPPPQTHDRHRFSYRRLRTD
ncbi:MAG: gamma-glutamylcyclotransferase [Hyphomicrobium sp.]